MLGRLTLHPDSACEAVTRVEAQATRSTAGLLSLRYSARGDPGGLVLPVPAAPARVDGLWRRTCFEAFVGAPGRADYFEFNFSPSAQWAAYRFDGYRAGMRPDAAAEDPRIMCALTEDGFELRAVVTVRGDGPWRIGLSAVIEEAGGRISYWALAHPPGKPDFHHPDGFILEIPSTERS